MCIHNQSRGKDKKWLRLPNEFKFCLTRSATIASTKSPAAATIREGIDRVYLQNDANERLEAVRALAVMQLPVADWKQMERESVEETTFDG